MSLPPFSGDEPTCLKCGWAGASTEHLPYGDCAHMPGSSTVIGWHPNERLHRECQRCSYQWDEAVIEPVHLGGGANAEDCPACKGTNPDYPFICPGPESEEPSGRPTHPDGTPYRYAEITAEGWEHCDCCGHWSKDWTPETPHKCPVPLRAARG